MKTIHLFSTLAVGAVFASLGLVGCSSSTPGVSPGTGGAKGTGGAVGAGGTPGAGGTTTINPRPDGGFTFPDGGFTFPDGGFTRPETGGFTRPETGPGGFGRD